MPTIRYNQRDVAKLSGRFNTSAGVMDAVGLFMGEQVKERFHTQGASSGIPWPAKRATDWGYHDGRAILTGPSGDLLRSFYGYGIDGNAIVASECRYSKIHQLGTIGKGGVMPDIRPRKAKALFIPLTDRAIHSERLIGAEAAAWGQQTGQVPYGSPGSGKARRFGVKQHETESGGYATEYVGLIKGRLKDGRLERWNAATGEYEPGIPDFIFLQKISIAPRPMLPTSDSEIRDTVMFLVDAMMTGTTSGRLFADGRAKGEFHSTIEGGLA